MMLDKLIFDFIYTNCQHLGRALGCGALEGFLTYLILIGGSISTVINRRCKN